MLATLETRPESRISIPAAFIEASKEKPEDKWWLLPGTGFNVRGEVERLKRDYLSGQAEGSTQEEALRRSVDEIRGNIIGYKWEYISQSVILANPLELEAVKGRKRLVNGISRLPLLEAITEKERYGAVKESFGKVEDFLATAEPGAMAVMASPTGWSGLRDNVGQNINYHDNQIYMWRKGEGEAVESFTMVTDLNLAQNHQLLRALGVSAPLVAEGDTRKTLANTVRNVAFLPQGGTFEQVVNLAEEVNGSSVARTIKDKDGRAIGKRTFAEAREKLKRKEELLSVDQDCDQLIAKLVQLVVQNRERLEDREFIEELEMKLGMTLLQMTRIIIGKEEPQPIKANMTYRLNNMSSFSDIKDDLAYLQSRPGCAGGGASLTLGSRGVLNTGIGASLLGGGSSLGESSSSSCGTCGEKLCMEYCMSETCRVKN